MKKPTKREGSTQCILDWLRSISCGKLNLTFYFRQKLQFSSKCGGLISLLLYAFFITYSLSIIIPVFDGTFVISEISRKPHQDVLDYSQVTYSDFVKDFERIVVVAELNANDTEHCNAHIRANLIVNDYNETVFFDNENICFDDICFCNLNLKSAQIQTLIDNLQSASNQSGLQLFENFTYRVEFQTLDKTKEIRSAILEYTYGDATLSNIYQGLKSNYSVNQEINIFQVDYIAIDNQTIGEQSLTLRRIESFIHYDSHVSPQNHLSIAIEQDLILQKVVVSTPSFLLALSKIGGLIAVLTFLSTLIEGVHWCQFQNKLRLINEGKEKNYMNQDDAYDIEDSGDFALINSQKGERQDLKSVIDSDNIEEIFSLVTYRKLIAKVLEQDGEIKTLKELLNKNK